MNSRNLLRLVHGFALVGVFAWLYAGNLTPPSGPITSTMKTLAHVEPRTAIESLSGSDDALFVITEPGSYYLTGNVVGETGKHGILILAEEDVTIDLMGFALEGVEGSLSGIAIPEDLRLDRLVRLRNGVVRNWGEYGVFDNSKFRGSWHIMDLAVYENGANGIIVNTHAMIKDCTVDRNVRDGLVVAGNSIIENSKARSNGRTGIWAQTSVVRGCVAADNGIGFRITRSSTAVDCLAYGNESVGIEVDGGVVRTCTVSSNQDTGIHATSAEVHNNSCQGSEVGIRILGSGSRVDGNRVFQCTTGVQSTNANSSVIVRNTVSVRNGGTSYEVSTRSTIGPIVQTLGEDRDLSNLSNGDHPWANLEF